MIPIIGNDVFVSCFGIVPAGDEDEIPRIVRNAVRQGFAVVPIAAGQKVPICTLTARQAKAADNQAAAAAREAGVRNWSRVRHKCGIEHALTDPVIADRVVKRLVKERGGVNIGVEVGRSRMVLVDADTADEVAGFLNDWSAESGLDMTGRKPTVTTPGVATRDHNGEQTWVHKDGGHFWFTVPADHDLLSLPGQGTLRADSGWMAVWRDHQALVPPSVRAEGAYAITGQVEPAPEWLLDRIQMHAHSYAERKARQQEKVHHDGDPIDLWSAGTSWVELLEPDGWSCTGLPERCGCPTWTRPGNPAHTKSAVAHEIGCTQFETDTGHGPLHIWTDNPPEFLASAVETLNSRTVTKLQYVAWRDHDGDSSAAMRELELAPIRAADPADDAALSEMLDSALPPTVPVEPVEEEKPADPIDRVTAIRDRLEADPKLKRDVLDLRRRDQAREIYQQILGMNRQESTLTAFDTAFDDMDTMPEDEDDIPWIIEPLWQRGQVVLLAAQFKVGKTTLNINTIRSLVDGTPFLGQFHTTQLDRRLVVVNAEMTGRQFRRWLRETNIENTHKVSALHVREAGPSAANIMDPATRDIWVKGLIKRETQTLILDPLNPLFSAAGIDENDNSAVGQWFSALNEIVTESNVESVLLVHHFGHNGERGRGASKIMDAPDVLWTYTLGDKPKRAADMDTDDLLGEIDQARTPRYLHAFGRDVDLSKSRVDYDPETRLLSMPQPGAGPGAARREASAKRDEQAQAALIARVVEIVADESGLSHRRVVERLGGYKTAAESAVNAAASAGLIQEEPGPRRSRLFRPVEGP